MQRYDYGETIYGPCMIANEHGGYVRYEDYADAQKEIGRLNKALDFAASQISEDKICYECHMSPCCTYTEDNCVANIRAWVIDESEEK